ncbi:hypothetical protein GOV05_03530 [Candidatus Woesearchaeota archaeon]|nr:hypothetical protein [Candidatus Woesearchaeota archaeon]
MRRNQKANTRIIPYTLRSPKTSDEQLSDSLDKRVMLPSMSSAKDVADFFYQTHPELTDMSAIHIEEALNNVLDEFFSKIAISLSFNLEAATYLEVDKNSLVNKFREQVYDINKTNKTDYVFFSGDKANEREKELSILRQKRKTPDINYQGLELQIH